MENIKLLYYSEKAGVLPSRVPKGRIRYYDLTVVQKGVLYYVLNDQTIAIKAGSFILMRPGELRHRIASDIPSDYVSFNFTSDMDLSAIPTINTDILSPEMSTLLSACNVFGGMENSLDKTAYVVLALLQFIKDNLIISQMNPLAVSIKNYILKHFNERITLSKISEEFHFSESHCNNVFKKETQKSIVDFLIDERIRKAKELLCYTNFSLTAIASQVGYDDYNYFARLFKKHTKRTPLQYRRQYTPK